MDFGHDPRARARRQPAPAVFHPHEPNKAPGSSATVAVEPCRPSSASHSAVASVRVPIGESFCVTRPFWVLVPYQQPLPLNDNRIASPFWSGSGSMRYGYPLRSCAVSGFGLVRSPFRSWVRIALGCPAQPGPATLCNLIRCDESFPLVVHGICRYVNPSWYSNSSTDTWLSMLELGR